MRFVIRDDDLNYFSKPEEIEQWYADLFAQKIPVGFAAVSFVRPASDIYPNLPLAPQSSQSGAENDKKEYSIGDNAELCAYLKNNPLIEIVQHGMAHEVKNGVFEYAWREGLVEKTARGKAELARALGKAPKVFAPPHDWIGTHGIVAIEAAGLNVIRGRGAGLRNWLWRWQYAAIFVRMAFFKLFHLGHVPAYPYILNFGKHQEACSYRLEDKDVFEGLKYAHKKDGIFVVVTHLHFYTDEKKARIVELIAKAREYGAEFVLPSTLFA